MCRKDIFFSFVISKLLEPNPCKIPPVIDGLIKTLKDCEDDDTKYKCVQCLYNIFKSYYDKDFLPNDYNSKIQSLIDNEKTNKIKFKMMDILERR